MSTATLAPTTADDLLRIDDTTADLLFREARTVNAFADEPVTDEQIQAAYDLVRWGPTAMNVLPLRLLLVRTPEARERLATHMADGNKAKTLAAPLSIVVAADTSFHEHMPTLAPHLTGPMEHFETAGPEGREPMARTNALIQIGYLIVGLRSVGLHVGPMTGFDSAGVDADLLAGTSWRSLVVMNVGTPAAENASYPRQTRLAFDQVSQAV